MSRILTRIYIRVNTSDMDTRSGRAGPGLGRTFQGQARRTGRTIGSETPRVLAPYTAHIRSCLLVARPQQRARCAHDRKAGVMAMNRNVKALSAMIAAGSVCMVMARESMLSAQQRPVPDHLRVDVSAALLAEVRALRADLAQVNQAAVRAQLLTARVQLQEQRVMYFDRRRADWQHRGGSRREDPPGGGGAHRRRGAAPADARRHTQIPKETSNSRSRCSRARWRRVRQMRWPPPS